MISTCTIHGKTEFTEPDVNLRSFCKECFKKEMENFSKKNIKAYTEHLLDSEKSFSMGSRIKISRYKFIETS